MQRSNRLAAELHQMATSLPAGIVCSQAADDEIGHLEAIIDGPPDSPYEGGRFHVDLRLPVRYPFEPPALRVITRIFHPNIDPQGRVCLSAIQLPPKGTWKPALNVCAVLTSLRAIIAQPTAEDPLMADVAELLQNDRAEFDRTARKWTQMHAMQTNKTEGSTSSAEKKSL
ncbi:ubiquitin-conjugating enzyme E2 T-like [Varroa destructor]|uniref:UBC core domain-containing protein n=1 Tax=Varroa destructor TaxID=109461 RepID=A0A7M7JEN0_VARDE|nr:ubiquitin-conjugating enzyme E2 T-like [Varroa destructor]XP_022646753.1 ubiquitin-conjugating enzyme E2 T-like [Varroa destructor]XP_022646754.1 ubiquitin-conjugating enzyme E2 T-like [Varroa destructor]XP_022646755.1 ubiquitin-conjugating enzyme E2 T-like [Varroa destructor]XP_022646756.1 ubiquitin-conjugating enzyme E2 T-like [Varroa destructor]XP_022646758.1 ubiquitin-conjugating enzyme E2 T-like [Varroa destructor]XP_022646759.1 ubiquitin-conjugating enzyme E2 T-like [Varroa destructo